MTKILRELSDEPVLILALLNAGLAVGVGFGAHLTKTETAGVITGATAVFGLITALRTRPVSPAALTTVFAAGLTAAAAFGLHLTPNRVGLLTAFLTAILAIVLRVHVSPAKHELFHSKPPEDA
jgi:hypothetical protein